MKKSRKHYRVKSPIRFIAFLVIVGGLTFGLFGLVTGLSTSYSQDVPEYTTVHVSTGDTLWDIAEKCFDNSTDPRDAVYMICEINEISPETLQAGMDIKVPKSL